MKQLEAKPEFIVLSRFVAVSRGYDTCFKKGLVMGYADCLHLLVLVETS